MTELANGKEEVVSVRRNGRQSPCRRAYRLMNLTDNFGRATGGRFGISSSEGMNLFESLGQLGFRLGKAR